MFWTRDKEHSNVHFRWAYCVDDEPIDREIVEINSMVHGKCSLFSSHALTNIDFSLSNRRVEGKLFIFDNFQMSFENAMF